MSYPTSRHSSRNVTIANSAEVFEVIREERSPPALSSININATSATSPPVPTTNTCAIVDNSYGNDEEESKDDKAPIVICPCKGVKDEDQEKKQAEQIEGLLKEKEIEMEEKFQERIEREMKYLKDRFAFILQNEQIRASHMLREAHREREEKISALQMQLECKNMAGLMYVLCAERRKSKMEILRITEDYTNYIQALQTILQESQALILNLSRGYKTAARVDHEWKEKMKKIIIHFQNFVNNFTGCPPEANQYLLHLPDLLKINAPIQDDPKEDPCESEHGEEEEESIENESKPDGVWWKNLEGQNCPFVMFGDMAEFKPPQRRDVLRAVKAVKTAPKKWKEYVFHDMVLKSQCPHKSVIKDQYLKRAPSPSPAQLEAWSSNQTNRQTSPRLSETSRRVTTASVDLKRRMGSILKIITSPTVHQPPTTPKATLLAARDSMEIASTTRLREKQRHTSEPGRVVLNIGNKIDSLFNEMYEGIEEEEETENETGFGQRYLTKRSEVFANSCYTESNLKRFRPSRDEDYEGDESMSVLGSIHHDSLTVISRRVPDQDHKIHYEKICPMEKCQKMQMDEFMQSLPSYMKASPFTYFDQTFEEYEACTPEQLEILKQKIEEKKKKERVVIDVIDDNPLLSWSPSIDNVAVQTSYDDIYLPPCTCDIPASSDTSKTSHKVYNIVDLIPVKQELERINAECFFREDIEFSRFKVIGQDENEEAKYGDEKDFSKSRLQEIKRILKQHPSLCEIFQANIRC